MHTNSIAVRRIPIRSGCRGVWCARDHLRGSGGAGRGWPPSWRRNAAQMPSCTASPAAVSSWPQRWPVRSTSPSRCAVVRKLGAPAHEEYAVGAIADGVKIVHPDAVEGAASRRAARVRGRCRARRARAAEEAVRGRSAPPVAGRTALVVDDGVATGATAMAACQALRCAGRRPDRPCRAGRTGRVATRRRRRRRYVCPHRDPRLLGGRPVLPRLHADDATRRSRDCCRMTSPPRSDPRSGRQR